MPPNSGPLPDSTDLRRKPELGRLPQPGSVAAKTSEQTMTLVKLVCMESNT